MNIKQWKGLVSAASPYALPAGAATRQNNLQIRKPGQLVPRPGLEPFFTSSVTPFLSLYRKSFGGTTKDSLFAWKPAQVIDANGGPVNGFAMFSIAYEVGDNGEQLNEKSLFSTAITPYSRPCFCEDRHGTVYAFFGSGIEPQTYRVGIDNQTVPFGMAAPTVAPSVTPTGDGWFIERVDVLSSGTSYYTAPSITVSGGSPDRNAVLRAVVQAGAIVAVDIVDGGSNFKEVPTITVGNEQIGTGFSGRGNLVSSAPTFGFRESTPGTVSAGYINTRTHSYSASGAEPTIAYKVGSSTAFVAASFSPVTGLFTALIPLTAVSPATGTDAFAEVKFQALSAAYKVGDVSPVGFTVDATYTSTLLTSAALIKFQSKRENWYTTNDYFDNTYTPAANNIPTRFSYQWYANRDKFWGLGPYPFRYVFAKSQQIEVGVTPDDWLGNNQSIQRWGDYFFPDYSHVSYYLLTGPENALNTKANWTLHSSPVQVDANGPFIDIPLLPAKKPNGTPYSQQNGTQYPEVRVYLSYCPEQWTLSNVGYPTGGALYGNRYTPQSGQDRRVNFDDTNYTPASGQNGANVASLHSNAQDARKRWYGAGHANGRPLARPITDFREGASTTSIGIAAGTLKVKSPGTLMEQGTKFAIRFYQFNAYDYLVESINPNAGWLTSTVQSPRLYKSRTAAEWQESSRGSSITSQYTDFYLMAGEVDTSQGGLSLLLPGPVITSPASEAPKVTITGRGWTAASQTARFTLRQQATPAQDGSTATFSDSDVYTFTTEELVPAVTGKRIGSVTILSGGQNYFREPTILYRGGGGYGLKLGATTSAGRVTNVAVLDGGDGFTSDTILYTEVQPAKLLPVLRGTMRGDYRCAYRFADYRKTVVRQTTLTTLNPLNGSKTVTLANVEGVKPGMVITGASSVRHMVKIVSLNGNTATLSHEPLATASAQACVIRDMTLPVTYSDFSPIADVTADVNGSGRASTMRWRLDGITAPARADHVEFYRTSADQSLVFYRLELYGTCNNGVISLSDGGSDGLSDEELFDIDRPGYAALPVVLPNGNVNAFRFGTARSDMAVAVAWQDRLWYGVSTSGADANTVFFSEFDEFESCPDVNELPIQTNLRSTDYMTALIPFGHVLMAMQNAHAYSLSYNTDPIIDSVITLVAHRGVLTQHCWDIYDDLLYAVDERGVYSMNQNGSVEVLSDAVRDYFDENRIDLSKKHNFFLKVDQRTGILRVFLVAAGSGATYPHFALCYHISNQTWWTETWPTALTCAADYRQINQPDGAVYGTVDGHIHSMTGLKDLAYRDIYSITVTNPGSGYKEPPTVTATGVGAAEFQAVVQDGKVTDILILYGGWGYGQVTNNNGTPVFNPAATITIEAPPSGVTATATALARVPLADPNANVYSRATVAWQMRTGPMELSYDGNTRGGDRQMERSITVTYRPTETAHILNLREYYNNSPAPRPNVMRRDRGTGFVHDTSGAKTTLDMSATRTALGLSTGLATAQFAGRSLGDLSSADRHLAIELSCDARDADAGDPVVSEPLIYSVEVRGVDGGE